MTSMTSWVLLLLTFLPFLCAVAAYVLGRQNERAMNRFVSGTGIGVFALSVLLVFLPEGSVALPDFCGLGLYLRADGFRGLYTCVAAFMWMMTGLFAPEYFRHHGNKARYSFFTLMTLGATLGVFLSDNLGTTFLFFEIMSFASYAWVAQEETSGALRAAGTYLAVAVIGGLTTLMGLFLLQHQLGTLDFAALRAAMGQQNVSVAVWLTLVGFGAKAGLFPLHIWLPKAHPVAPAPASALLSGILTKSGVFGLIVLCANLMQGNAAFGNALMVLAVITMFLGAVLALFSTDLKRTLACSSMSQIGFIVLGLSVMVLLGEEGTLAAYGSVMHMLNHSLIKLTLFMAAGVVYMNLHALNLDDIRGFGRRKPLLHLAFLLGALSIACIPPLGSGYNSKSLLHEALLELIGEAQVTGGPWTSYKAVEVLFLISGGLTVAYMTKLYLCIFWQKHPTRQAEFDGMTHYMNGTSAFALLGSAAVLPFLGALPNLLLSPLGAKSAAFFGVPARGDAIAYFSAENLQGAAISIGIGLAVYLLIVLPLLTRKNDAGQREYLDRWPKKLDLENAVYRPVLLTLLPQGLTLVFRFIAELPENLVMVSRATIFRMRQTRRPVPVGNRFTYTLGRALDALARLLNRTLLHRHPMRTDFEYVLDASFRELASGIRSMSVSISFGLLLLCIGLYVTCLYLLQ